MLVKQFNYISKEEANKLLDAITFPKHKVIVLLMLDAGLRVSEACSIKYKNFDFKNKTLTIQSAKKKGAKHLRTVPLSNRLYQAIAIYLESTKIKKDPNAFLFPSSSTVEGHISRKTIWDAINKIKQEKDIPNLHPHALRHSFATHHLSAGSSLPQIKEMLGHSNFNTTLIYAAVPTEELRERVNTVTNSPLKWYNKLFNFIAPKPRQKLINLDFSESYFTVGRNDELLTLNNNIQKKINTLITGPIGVGKSHLLKNITTDNKILRLDDTENIKKSLIQILLYLYKEKEAVLKMLWKDATLEEINKKVQRENTIHLCDTIISAVKPLEYCLIIDDITTITPTAKKVIERLKDSFIIIAAAREIKATNTSFIWNFERIQLKPLNRKESFQLIHQLASNLDYENKDVFCSHIYDQTNGNPRAINELINRYKKEPFLDIETIKEIRHTGALREIDMTWIVILFLGLVTCLRYLSRDLDEPALRFIGTIAMMVLFMFRPLYANFRRKFL